MKKTRSTKRALLMSALSLLLCVSMLVGSTFAWFTDSVTSAGNIIQSGTLDVDLVDAEGNSMAGQVVEFVAADGRAQDKILWEPGCTYNTEPVKVINKGNLALKYKVLINGIDGDAKLLEAIEWTVTIGGVKTDLSAFEGKLLSKEESGEIVLSGHMKEEAGNEYQGLTVEGISIVVYATQVTAEFDSFDDQYDKFADYDGEISNAVSLAAALKNGGTYKVLNDIAVDGESFEVPAGKEVVLDIGGNTISGNNTTSDGAVVVNNGTLTLTNGTISSGTVNGAEAIVNNGTMVLKNVTVNGAPMATTGYPAYAVGTSGKLTIEEGTKVYADRGALRTSNGAELIINGGEFIVSNAADGRNMMNHVVYAYGANTTVTINGGYFEYNHTSTGGASVVCPYYATIIVNGGDFRDVMDDSNWKSVGNFQNYMGTKAPVVYGGTYDDTTHTKWLAEGYSSVKNADGTYTVHKGIAANTAGNLDSILAGGGDAVLTGNLNFDASETSANSGYGATGVSVNGGTLDGNGNSLGINNWGTWDAAVHTTGGTIKNLTINSGMRGIFMGSATADVYIDNVVIDGTIYTFNSDGGNKDFGVYISNSTLNGWTSHSDVHKEVVYTNCNFGEGQGYAYCRPYGPTTFENCDFEAGFEIGSIGKTTFKNCTIGGEPLTAENLSTLVTSNIANATVIG